MKLSSFSECVSGQLSELKRNLLAEHQRHVATLEFDVASLRAENMKLHAQHQPSSSTSSGVFTSPCNDDALLTIREESSLRCSERDDAVSEPGSLSDENHGENQNGSAESQGQSEEIQAKLDLRFQLTSSQASSLRGSPHLAPRPISAMSRPLASAMSSRKNSLMSSTSTASIRTTPPVSVARLQSAASQYTRAQGERVKETIMSGRRASKFQLKRASVASTVSSYGMASWSEGRSPFVFDFSNPSSFAPGSASQVEEPEGPPPALPMITGQHEHSNWSEASTLASAQSVFFPAEMQEFSEDVERDRRGERTSVNIGEGAGSDSILEGPESQDPDFVFSVWPVWTPQARTYSMSRSRTGVVSIAHKEEDSESDDDIEEEAIKSNLLARLILNPSHPFRLAWDLFGFFFIGFEYCTLPLQLLGLEQSTFLRTVAWIIRIYWTCDLPLSLITGYPYADGQIELHPSKVARNYLVTWMPIDSLILFLDWLELVLASVENLGAARLGKALKALRMVRVIRLLRLISRQKMPDFLRVLAYRLNAERFVIVFGIIEIMLVLIAITHLIACLWYGVGVGGWVSHYGYADASIFEKYMVAFHWSLTQYTGNSAVYAQTLSEKSFAVGSLLFGFLVGACVVSRVTSSMTRLQIVSARQSTQAVTLKNYLTDHAISTKLALRVQKNAQFSLQQAARKMPEDAVELLQLVSEPLRVEVHYEMYMPVLTWHLFFRAYDEVHGAGMRRICHSSVTNLSVSRGDILFSSGEIPQSPAMYFCTAGRLQYIQEFGHGSGCLAQSLGAKQWACEAVLWTPWVHIGTLRAKAESTMMLLDAVRFQTIAQQFQTQENYPQNYAAAFVRSLNATDKESLSDLANFGFDIADICRDVFPDIDAVNGVLNKPGVKRDSLEEVNITSPVSLPWSRMANLFSSFYPWIRSVKSVGWSTPTQVVPANVSDENAHASK